MSAQNLILELFVEELPPKALKKLGESFAQVLTDSLKAQDLLAEQAAMTAFASPRRLGVHVQKVLAQAPDKALTHKLMPVSVGLDAQQKPTPALLKKLAALGLPESVTADLQIRPEGKAEALFIQTQAKGVALTEGLQKALLEAMAKLPIPKVMSYQLADGWTTVNFVRPVHGLLALHGDQVVPLEVLGLKAGRQTQGHRFESAQAVVVRDADSYEQQLRDEGAVVAQFATRKAQIVAQLSAAAQKVGLVPIEDEALLDEVTALVERPHVVMGQFEESFLQVPQECLILTMKANQKYFPLLDTQGRLTHRFLIVSNISPLDESRVIQGNERVVRPRLADAQFFFNQDRKKPLSARMDALNKVVYHNKLGTQGERSVRVQALAEKMAEQWLTPAQVAEVKLAAPLSKADLVTDMVGEFPELQGIMGRYYALHEGLPESVAHAIEDHYRPRFAGDDLPRNPVGLCVALADKLETLVGLFGIGQLPTGDKDPFALRRHALGVIRMLVEKDLPLSLPDLLALAVPVFGDKITDPQETLLTFFYERLEGSLREQGFSAQEVEAVLSLRPPRLGDVLHRLQAVRHFAALPQAASLAAANKRISNILKKEQKVDAHASEILLREEAEKHLHMTLQQLAPAARAQFDAGDYTASLTTLAGLRDAVDAFFEGVMVNAEDLAVRTNRQGLLACVQLEMNRVADLSKLAN